MIDANIDAIPDPTGYTVDRLETLVALRRQVQVHSRRPAVAATASRAALRRTPLPNDERRRDRGPAGRLAAPNTYLHLWTTHSFLFESRRVWKRGGFRRGGVRLGEAPNGHRLLLAQFDRVLGPRGEGESHLSRPLDPELGMPRPARAQSQARAHPHPHRARQPRPVPGTVRAAGRPHGWVVFGDEISRGLFDDEVLELDAESQFVESFAPPVPFGAADEVPAPSSARCLAVPAPILGGSVPSGRPDATGSEQFQQVVDLLAAIAERPPPKVEPPKYLTVQDAATYCRVAVQTIYNNRRYISRMPGVRKLLFTREAARHVARDPPGPQAARGSEQGPAARNGRANDIDWGGGGPLNSGTESVAQP